MWLYFYARMPGQSDGFKMNRMDKRWYKALRFLSRLSVDKALKMKKENLGEFRKYVSENLERTLVRHQFIILEGNYDNIVSLKGLKYLRDLEDIERKDLTLIAAAVAVVISVVALAKSTGWI